MPQFFRSLPARNALPVIQEDAAAPLPPNEAQRLAVVRQLRLLDTAPEERFDRFTRLACAALRMPIALLTLMDGSREWFKSAHGLRQVQDVPRTHSFGAHAVLGDSRLLVVRDASKDRRFAAHPLVQGPEKIRFFAGRVLANADGIKVGLLCVMDRQPQDFPPASQQALADLAQLAEQELRGLPLRDTLERLAQAERRAEEQHARFAVFMENLPNVAFLKDSEGCTIFANRCHQEMFGVKLADVTGKRDDEWLPPEVAAATMAADRLVIATGSTLQLEEEIPTILGARHWLTFRFPVPTPSGERLLGGVAVDITEQKQTEQKLQDLLTLQRAIVDSANVAIISTGPDGLVRNFNATAERLLGYRAEEIIGRATPEIWHDSAELQRIASQIERESGEAIEPGDAVLRWGLEAGGVVEHELTHIRKDGSTFPGALSITPLRASGAEITGYMRVIQDITERRLVEDAQRHAREEAEAANRAKSQFLANMSHEVRTPLNGVLGVTAMLLETDLQPEQRQFAEIVLTSAEGLLSIVNDILDFSKIEAGRTDLEKIDFELPGLLHSVAELQTARANEKCLSIETEIAPDVPPRLHGDPLRLRQVLNNLLGNAIKFSDHGQIRLVVRVEQETMDGVMLRFDVADCGIGIAPEKQARIFEPFTQADVSTTRLFGGTGLGLSISRQLVELMGGCIGVQSEPGRGSDFWFTASFGVAAETAESDGLLEVEEAEPLPKLRVLLAEDSAINRLVATHQLRKLGCDVEAVDDGQQAIDATATMRFDLVLMDCQMPVLDGYAATAAIRAREAREGSYTRIIALTANAMKGEKERCLAAGMDGYLSKPFKPAELHSLIDAVMRRVEQPFADLSDDAPLNAMVLADLRRESVDDEGDHFPEYVELFCEAVAEAERDLAEDANDLEALRGIAHRLRGAAANFGAIRLMALCAGIEQHAAAGNLLETVDLLEPLGSELSRVVAALREDPDNPISPGPYESPADH
jgi:PAS domain S-box-containing protein